MVVLVPQVAIALWNVDLAGFERLTTFFVWNSIQEALNERVLFAHPKIAIPY